MNMRYESSDRNESNIVVRVVNVIPPMIPIADSRNLDPSIHEASYVPVVFDHDQSK